MSEEDLVTELGSIERRMYWLRRRKEEILTELGVNHEG